MAIKILTLISIFFLAFSSLTIADIKVDIENLYRINNDIENDEYAEVHVLKGDYNSDGIIDYAAYSNDFCGSSGCIYNVYSKINEKYCMVGQYDNDISTFKYGGVFKECNDIFLPVFTNNHAKADRNETYIFDANRGQLSCIDYFQLQENVANLFEQNIFDKKHELELSFEVMKLSKLPRLETRTHIYQEINKGKLPISLGPYFDSIRLSKGFWTKVDEICDKNFNAAVAGVVTHLVIPIYNNSISKPRWVTIEQFEKNTEKYFDDLVALIKIKAKPQALAWYTKERLIKESIELAKQTNNEIFIYGSFVKKYKKIDIEHYYHLKRIQSKKEEKEEKKKRAKSKQFYSLLKIYETEYKKLEKEYYQLTKQINDHYFIAYHAKFDQRPGNRDFYKALVNKYSKELPKEIKEIQIHIHKHKSILMNNKFDEFKLDKNRINKIQVLIDKLLPKIEEFKELKTFEDMRQYVQ